MRVWCGSEVWEVSNGSGRVRVVREALAVVTHQATLAYVKLFEVVCEVLMAGGRVRVKGGVVAAVSGAPGHPGVCQGASRVWCGTCEWQRAGLQG